MKKSSILYVKQTPVIYHHQTIIPEEIFEYILEYLDYRNVFKLSSVSKTFKFHSYSDRVWKRIFCSIHEVLPSGPPRLHFVQKQESNRKWFEMQPDRKSYPTSSTNISTLKYNKSNTMNGSGMLFAGQNNSKITSFTVKNGVLKENKTFYDRLMGHTSSVLCLDTDSNNRMISSGFDNCICIWNTESGRLTSKMKLESNYGGIWATKFLSPYTAVVCGDGGDVKVYDLEEKKALGSFDHGKAVYDLILKEHDRNVVISASCDKTVAIWDVRDQSPVLFDTGEINYELNLFNDHSLLISNRSMIQKRDLRKTDQILSSFYFNENVSSGPIRGIHHDATRTFCCSKSDISILSDHPHRQGYLKNYSLVNSIPEDRISTAQYDDDFAILGTFHGQIIVRKFVEEKNKCSVQ